MHARFVSARYHYGAVSIYDVPGIHRPTEPRFSRPRHRVSRRRCVGVSSNALMLEEKHRSRRRRSREHGELRFPTPLVESLRDDSRDRAESRVNVVLAKRSVLCNEAKPLSPSEKPSTSFGRCTRGKRHREVERGSFREFPSWEEKVFSSGIQTS